MFEWNSRYNLNIDYDLFGYIQDLEKSPSLTTDDLHYALLAMVCGIAISNPYALRTYTTLDNIIITVAQDIDIKVKPKVRTGLMNGFNNLKRYGIIKMNELFTGDKKQVVSIDFGTLEHMTKDNDGNTVENIQISREELSAIIKGSNVPHHLIAIMLNYCSRFNLRAYGAFKTWKPNIGKYELEDYISLSTWISYDISITTWANCFGNTIERKNKWDVSKVQFSNYCTELVELGVFDRIIKNFIDGKNSYYFRPMHRKCVEWAIELKDKQQAYAKKQSEIK